MEVADLGGVEVTWTGGGEGGQSVVFTLVYVNELVVPPLPGDLLT